MGDTETSPVPSLGLGTGPAPATGDTGSTDANVQELVDIMRMGDPYAPTGDDAPEGGAEGEVPEQAAPPMQPEPLPDESKSFAAEAQRERLRRQRERGASMELDRLRAERENAITVDSLRADPWAALERAGVPVDTLTDALIARSRQPGAQAQKSAMELRIEQLEGQLAARQQAEQQSTQQAQYEHARSTVAAGLEAASDRFPYLTAIQDPTETASNILNTMRAEYQRTGELPSAEDIAARFEREAETSYKRMYTKLHGAQAQAPQASQPPQRSLVIAPNRSTHGPSPILTNRSATQSTAIGSGEMTEQERMNAAVAALREANE